MQANVNNKVGKTENRLDLQNIEVGKWGEAGCYTVIQIADCWRQWGAGVGSSGDGWINGVWNDKQTLSQFHIITYSMYYSFLFEYTDLQLRSNTLIQTFCGGLVISRGILVIWSLILHLRSAVRLPVDESYILRVQLARCALPKDYAGN